MPRHPVLWIAHRGASQVAPENTLAAIGRAVARRCDGVEFDVRGTRDGHIVLMHDAALDRTTTGSGLVAELSLRQIRRADAGAKKNKRFAGERVPTLREALGMLKEQAIAVIEVKDPDIGPAVVAELQRHHMLGQSVAISFHDATLRAMAQAEPRLCASLLVSPDREQDGDRQAEALVERARVAGAHGLDLGHQCLSAQLVRGIRRRGLSVWTWTVNDPIRAGRVAAMGVDAITTDAVRLSLPT